ncbi:MAG: cytochrome c3 family protein [Bryobacterales bacterium]
MAQCQTCHVGGQYAGLGTACVNCHQTDYDQTTSPDHAAAGFPVQCEACHSTTQWLGAVFDHSNTNFPLTGAHATTPKCADCHVNGQFQGTPTDCYSCHRTEYESVASPNHAAAGFPITCQDCHTTLQWTGATFNHSFPIYSGAHKQSIWQTCSTCHPNSSNFSEFTCLVCHEHSKTRMDDKHSGIRGYVYNSANCLACHPNGRH